MADKRIDEIMGSSRWPESPTPPRGPGNRMKWSPGAATPKPAENPRFQLPAPNPKPEMNYLGQGHLDELIARIEAEEAQPPHKKNAARISALKQQAMEMMKRLESQWVQRSANGLLPRLEEDQAEA